MEEKSDAADRAHIQKEEELSEAFSISKLGSHKIEKDADPESVINLQSLTFEELEKFTEDYIKEIGQQTFVARSSEDGTFENTILSYINGYSQEAARILEFAAKHDLVNDPKFDSKIVGENGKTRVGTAAIYSPKKIYNTPLTGREAQIAYKARKKGAVRRVPLLNSGIVLTLRAPHIYEVSSFIETVVNEDVNYGREAGVQYFSFANFVLTRACLDFAIDLVVDSSLKDWDTKDRAGLLKAIQFPDLNHLFMQVVALMYPKGYPNFKLACFNKDCNHITEPLKVDTKEFVRHRFAAMPEACIKYLEETRTRSSVTEFKDIDKYLKDLGFDGKTIEIDEYRYTFKVPSADDYIAAGSKVVADILADIQGSSEDRKFMAISSRSLLTYLPWITKIEVLTFEDDVEEVEPIVAMEFTDPDTMADVLTDLVSDVEHEQKLTEAMFKMIDECQLTLICYSPGPCPECGETPQTKTGMVSLDPLSSFFTQAYWLVKQHFMRRAELSQQSKSTQA